MASDVVALESDPDWHAKLSTILPANATIHLVAVDTPANCLRTVEKATQGSGAFDVIVIDGLWRADLIPLAIDRVTRDGCIICDNSDGYGIYDGFHGKAFQRIDFYGNAPGVIMPHATSIFFRNSCFLFNGSTPI